MAPTTILLLAAAAVKVNANANFPHIALNIFGDVGDCAAVVATNDACEAAIPTWQVAPPDELFGCFCCDDGKWDPSEFDDSVSDCYDYLTDVVPTATADISLISDMIGICGDYGSVPCMGAPTQAPTRTTDTSAAITGCANYKSKLNECASKIDDLLDQPPNVVNGCLCYEDGDWEPGTFDGYIDECLDYLSVADTSSYSDFMILSDVCSSWGPVVTADKVTTTTTPRELDDPTPTPVADQDGDNDTAALPSSTTTIITTISPDAAPGGNAFQTPITRGGIFGFLVWVLGFYVM